MNIIKEDTFYKIYWYNEEESIILAEVYSGWTWQSATDGLEYFNNQIAQASQTKPIYAIIHLTTGAQIMPRGHSAINAIRNLLRQDPSHEKLTVFVTEVGILNSFLKLASNLYGFRDKINKYRFTSTITEALQIIGDDQQVDNS